MDIVDIIIQVNKYNNVYIKRHIQLSNNIACIFNDNNISSTHKNYVKYLNGRNVIIIINCIQNNIPITPICHNLINDDIDLIIMESYKHNDMKIIKKIQNQITYIINNDVIYNLCKNGNLRQLKKLNLVENDFLFCNERNIFTLCEHDHLHVIKYLISNKIINFITIATFTDALSVIFNNYSVNIMLYILNNYDIPNTFVNAKNCVYNVIKNNYDMIIMKYIFDKLKLTKFHFTWIMPHIFKSFCKYLKYDTFKYIIGDTNLLDCYIIPIHRDYVYQQKIYTKIVQYSINNDFRFVEYLFTNTWSNTREKDLPKNIIHTIEYVEFLKKQNIIGKSYCFNKTFGKYSSELIKYLREDFNFTQDDFANMQMKIYDIETIKELNLCTKQLLRKEIYLSYDMIIYLHKILNIKYTNNLYFHKDLIQVADYMINEMNIKKSRVLDKLICYALDDIDVINYMHKIYKNKLFDHVPITSISLNVLKYCHETLKINISNYIEHKQLKQFLQNTSSFDIVKYLHNECSVNFDMCNLHEKNHMFNVHNLNFDKLIFLEKICNCINYNDIFHTTSDINIIKHISHHIDNINSSVMLRNACKNNNLELIKFLHYKYKLTKTDFTRDNNKLMQYLLNHSNNNNITGYMSIIDYICRHVKLTLDDLPENIMAIHHVAHEYYNNYFRKFEHNQ